MRTHLPKIFLVSAALAMPALAFAHVGTAASGHHAASFSDGLLHPFTGLDHLFVMLALGLWSAIATRRIWLAPLAFASMLSVGAMLGMAGLALPAVEPMIVASMLVTGLLLLTRARLPSVAAAALAGLFALFHGVAHGTELGGSAHILAPLLGMLTSTIALHAVGLSLGLALRMRNRWWPRAAGSLLAQML